MAKGDLGGSTLRAWRLLKAPAFMQKYLRVQEEFLAIVDACLSTVITVIAWRGL